MQRVYRVLPLTREWIEIESGVKKIHAKLVLPLTREWIEIRSGVSGRKLVEFSLLRGSGLKSNWKLMIYQKDLGSPSYEGVD